MRVLAFLCALVLVCAMADGKPFFDAIYEALNGGRRSWGYPQPWQGQEQAPQARSRGNRQRQKSRDFGAICRVHNPNSHLGGGTICPFN